jgi:Methyltransferase domain
MMASIINKTMDLNDLKSEKGKTVVKELNELITNLRDRNLRISSWYGVFDLSADAYISRFERANRGYDYTPLENAVDDDNFPWFLYWEIMWLYTNNDYRSEQSILDLGGSSSLFSYYLASKGFNVTTVDIKQDLVDNANHVAQEMGWQLRNFAMDMRNLTFDSEFDHITSVCVYEHVPMYDRLTINEKISDLLREAGTFSITFDYRNPSKHACSASPQDLYEQFVRPSGLKIKGNHKFYDNDRNYLLSPFYSKMLRSLG